MASLSDYKNLVEFLGRALGPHVEVVLHDTSVPDQSIVAIANGHISGREVGGPVTDFALWFMKQGRANSGAPYETGYRAVNGEGRICRSSSYFIRDDSGELIGMICINRDLSNLLDLQSVVSSMLDESAMYRSPLARGGRNDYHHDQVARIEGEAAEAPRGVNSAQDSPAPHSGDVDDSDAASEASKVVQLPTPGAESGAESPASIHAEVDLPPVAGGEVPAPLPEQSPGDAQLSPVSTPSDQSSTQVQTGSAEGVEGETESGTDPLMENLQSSLTGLMRQMLGVALSKQNVAPARMKVAERQHVVKDLDDAGFFLLKGGIAAAAEALAVSEPTIYRYLVKVRQ